MVDPITMMVASIGMQFFNNYANSKKNEEIQEKLIEVANRRYATKKFDPDRKVDDDDWRTILEVGRLSPSSFG